MDELAIDESEITSRVLGIGHALAAAEPSEQDVRARIVARARRRARRRGICLAFAVLLGSTGAAMLATRDEGSPGEVVIAGKSESQRVNVDAQWLDGTRRTVAFSLPPGPVVQPALVATAPVALQGCCPNAIAIARRSDSSPRSTPQTVLGRWRLPSGQPTSLVDRRGRSVLVIDAKPYVIEISVPELTGDVRAGREATANLQVIRSGSDGLIVRPVADDRTTGHEVTIDLGSTQPFISLLKQQCSAGPTPASLAVDRPTLTVCIEDQQILAVAQGDSESDVRAVIESLSVRTP